MQDGREDVEEDAEDHVEVRGAASSCVAAHDARGGGFDKFLAYTNLVHGGVVREGAHAADERPVPRKLGAVGRHFVR